MFESYITLVELSWQNFLNVLFFRVLHCLKEVTHFSQVNACFSVGRPKHSRPRLAAKIESLRTHERTLVTGGFELGSCNNEKQFPDPMCRGHLPSLHEKLTWRDGEMPCLWIHVSNCSSCMMMFNAQDHHQAFEVISCDGWSARRISSSQPMSADSWVSHIVWSLYKQVVGRNQESVAKCMHWSYWLWCHGIPNQALEVTDENWWTYCNADVTDLSLLNADEICCAWKS